MHEDSPPPFRVGVVFELGRAANNVPSMRWRNYRAAVDHASDAATVLDILVAQGVGPASELERARTLVRELIADVFPLTNG